MALATFGMGCFWKPQHVFDKMRGVTKTEVGYAGGRTENPTYEEVCTDETGHAEVVRIEFDPTAVSYDELLAQFFAHHDPTQVDRQGPDVGRQYRSVIFTHDDSQYEAALRAVGRASKQLGRPVATIVEPLLHFYAAEEYHQKYLDKHRRKTCGF